MNNSDIETLEQLQTELETLQAKIWHMEDNNLISSHINEYNNLCDTFSNTLDIYADLCERNPSFDNTVNY